MRKILLITLLIVPSLAFARRLDPPEILTEEKTYAPDAVVEWTELDGASYYVLQALTEMPKRSQKRMKDDEIIYENTNVVGNREPLFRGDDIRPDMVVFVRVRGVDSDGKEGKWSDAKPIKVMAPPPELQAPVGEITLTRTPDFLWTPPNIENYVLELEVSTDEDFIQTVGSATFEERDAKAGKWESDFQHDYLEDYYARMRTRWTAVFPGDKKAREYVSDWSETRVYTIAYYVPVIESPTENLIVYSLNPELIYSHSPEPDGWNIEIGTGKSFEGKELLYSFSLPNVRYYPGTRIDEETGEFRYIFPLNLAPERGYFWRVRSIYGPDYGAWTPTYSFRLPRPADEAFRATRVEKTGDRHEVYPSFSPDGTTIAYNSYPASTQTDPVEAQREDLTAPIEIDLKPVVLTGGIFQEIRNTRQAFTSELRTPNGPSRDVRPAWDPESKSIFFSSNRYSRGSAITKKDQGSSAMTIIRSARQDESLGYPSVSPDGELVTLSLVPGEALRRRNPNADEAELYRLPLIPEGEEMRIWTCNARTGAGFTELVKGVYSAFDPTSQTLAYVRYVDKARKIWTYNLDTGENRMLSLEGKAETEYHFPAYSPDGQALAFASNLSGNWDIYYTDLKTGTIVQVTNSLAEDIMPAFSPDGSRIIFASKRDASNYDLWYVKVREPRPLLPPATPTPEAVAADTQATDE